MYFITIDCGTTNTRAKVWMNDHSISQSYVGVGVRDTSITGSKKKLQDGVRVAIEQALLQAKIRSRDLFAIFASGMITSNVGLYEVPHLAAPAGIKELAANMVQTVIPEVSPTPIWFIPGVKNNCGAITIDNCEEMDMMRGEETEVVGIIEKCKITKPAVFLLPGSHTKIVNVNGQGGITGCMTTLSGELLEVITHQTILANAVDHSFVTSIDEHFLLKGAESSLKVGLGRTCFSVRIVDLFTKLTVNEKANFLLGAVLGNDLLAMKNSTSLTIQPESLIVVSGKKNLKAALEVLLCNDVIFKSKLLAIPEIVNEDLAGLGAIAIAKTAGILR